MSDFSVVIAGNGVVGRLTAKLFQSCVFYDTDPEKSNCDLSKTYDLLLICTPTDLSEDQSLDCEHVFRVARLIKARYTIVRSTLTLAAVRTARNLGYAYWPEFCGNTVFSDGLRDVVLASVYPIKAMLRKILPSELQIHRVKYEEAYLLKMAENSFLAVKVLFFHKIYKICHLLGINFEVVRNLLTQDDRIGKSHSFFLGHYGYDSHCLLKDVPSFIEDVKKILPEPFFLSEVNFENNLYRLRDSDSPSLDYILDILLKRYGNKDLAHLLGVSESYVSALKHHKKKISKRVLKTLMKIGRDLSNFE